MTPRDLFWCWLVPLLGAGLVCLVLALVSCTPAIIGLSVAAGGVAVGATYEVTRDPCDAGKPPPSKEP